MHVLSIEDDGSGLSIVKRTSEDIGWNIRCEVPPAGGSRLIFRLVGSISASRDRFMLASALYRNISGHPVDEPD